MAEARIRTATSLDDAWLDTTTFWSMAEHNSAFEIISTINSIYLSPGQTYLLQIMGGGLRPARVILTANEETGPTQVQLQHLADCLCRLLRPSRYFESAEEDSEDEVWSQIFTTASTSSHERLRQLRLIPDMAGQLGRSDYGIEAAMAEINGWSDNAALRELCA